MKLTLRFTCQFSDSTQREGQVPEKLCTESLESADNHPCCRRYLLDHMRVPMHVPSMQCIPLILLVVKSFSFLQVQTSLVSFKLSAGAFASKVWTDFREVLDTDALDITTSPLCWHEAKIEKVTEQPTTLHFRTKGQGYHPVTLCEVTTVGAITTNVMRTTRKTVKMVTQTARDQHLLQEVLDNAQSQSAQTAKDVQARMQQRFFKTPLMSAFDMLTTDFWN